MQDSDWTARVEISNWSVFMGVLTGRSFTRGTRVARVEQWTGSNRDQQADLVASTPDRVLYLCCSS